MFLGKNPIATPADESLTRKFSILSAHLSATVIGVGSPGRRWVGGTRVITFPPRPASICRLLFYSLSPFVALSVARRSRSSAIVCQSPYEGFGVIALSRALSWKRPRVVIEVHGDWKSASRLYGRRARRLLTPVADRMAVWALRRADRVRVVSEFTERLVRRAGFEGSMDRFVAFSDYRAFVDEPLAAFPPLPTVCFVGALEASKGPDLLLEAWALVTRRIPSASLEVAGVGPLLPALRRRARVLGIDGSVRFLGHVAHAEVGRIIDRSWCVAVPSRTEGLARVVLEASIRARPVVATSVGGIPEIVDDGSTGLLAPFDAAALADAVCSALGNRPRLEAMGRAARRVAQERDLPGEFEGGITRLASWVAGS